VEQLATTLFEERHNRVDHCVGSIQRDLVTGVLRYHQATCPRRSSDRLVAGPPRAILAFAIPHIDRRRASYDNDRGNTGFAGVQRSLVIGAARCAAKPREPFAQEFPAGSASSWGKWADVSI
jgi:hypothetical protein